MFTITARQTKVYGVSVLIANVDKINEVSYFTTYSPYYKHLDIPNQFRMRASFSGVFTKIENKNT